MNDVNEPINAIEARIITEQSSSYNVELERTLSRIYRHIRTAASQGLPTVSLSIGPLVNAKDVYAKLKEQGFKIKVSEDDAWACW